MQTLSLQQAKQRECTTKLNAIIAVVSLATLSFVQKLVQANNNKNITDPLLGESRSVVFSHKEQAMRKVFLSTDVIMIICVIFAAQIFRFIFCVIILLCHCTGIHDLKVNPASRTSKQGPFYIWYPMWANEPRRDDLSLD